jgi:hypothetical protein
MKSPDDGAYFDAWSRMRRRTARPRKRPSAPARSSPPATTT